MPQKIINELIDKNLVIFCGAGISTETITVLPFTFYSMIYNELKNDKVEVDNSMSFSELMSIFVQNHTYKDLVRLIRERFDYINSFPELKRSASRFHREVASIPQIETIITTNWDEYFEKYCNATPIVNEEDTALWDAANRRVFKIHGSINNLGSIVATKEDYKVSFDNLQKGPMGARLKTILANSTVVFIGYSFGDENINKVIELLTDKTGKYANKYYLVTLDKRWEGSLNIHPIITCGTNFIHKLKNILVNMGQLRPDNLYRKSECLNQITIKKHTKFVEENHKQLKSHPEILLSIAYQDGIIHAYQRAMNDSTNGKYLIPDYLHRSIFSYQKLIENEILEGKIDKASYYYGYQNGLISLLEEFDLAPPFFIFYNEKNKTFEEVDNIDLIIEKYENKNTSIYKYCNDIINSLAENIIPHYPPY